MVQSRNTTNDAGKPEIMLALPQFSVQATPEEIEATHTLIATLKETLWNSRTMGAVALPSALSPHVVSRPRHRDDPTRADDTELIATTWPLFDIFLNLIPLGYVCELVRSTDGSLKIYYVRFPHVYRTTRIVHGKIEQIFAQKP